MRQETNTRKQGEQTSTQNNVGNQEEQDNWRFYLQFPHRVSAHFARLRRLIASVTMSFILYSGTPRSRAYIVSISRPVKRSSRASNYIEKTGHQQEEQDLHIIAAVMGLAIKSTSTKENLMQFYDYTAGQGSFHKLSPRFITLSQQRYKFYSRQKLRNNCLKGE